MTVCNMSHRGRRAGGLIAPDDTTFAYLEGRPHAPQGAACDEAALDAGGRCAPTTTRRSTNEVVIDAGALAPVRDLGHQSRPGGTAGRRRCPIRPRCPTPGERAAAERALAYMGLDAGHADA